jgi:hypothetical protein
MGQFLGLFSDYQTRGMDFWVEALLYLHPWYLLPVTIFIAGLRERSPIQALYLIIAIVLMFFLANVTVIRMRHYVPVFFFLAPVLFEGTRAMIEIASKPLRTARWQPPWSAVIALAILAVFAMRNLAYVYPTIDYRLRYAPAHGFYGPLSGLLPDDALLLGMDNCPIARYEAGLPCENHPPDLDAAAAQKYSEAIAGRASRRPVYILPDFYAYDVRRHLRRAFASAAVMRAVYTGWWESYHQMTYGISVDDTIARQIRRHPDCRLENRRVRPVRQWGSRMFSA